MGAQNSDVGSHWRSDDRIGEAHGEKRAAHSQSGSAVAASSLLAPSGVNFDSPASQPLKHGAGIIKVLLAAFEEVARVRHLSVIDQAGTRCHPTATSFTALAESPRTEEL